MSHTVSSSSPRLAANVSETSTLASTAVAAAHELVRTMGPIVLWLLLFANCKYIPSEWRPTISVATLPVLDKFLFESGFGLLLSACVCVAVGTWWLRSSVSAGYFAFVPLVLAALHDLANVDPNAAFDLALFLPYGILHYISPVLFTAWLYKYGPPGSIRVFLQALGWQNFAGVVTQLVFPCAAPWYNDKYGFQPANYSIPGDPAGLSNVDALLGTHMFTNTFNSSPLVFGAMPSLHSGFACLIMFFALHISPRAGRAAVAYVAWMWTATMYFRHHYMVDVIAGCGYAFVAYWVARPVLGVKAEIALPAPAIAGPARRRSLSESLSASGAGLRPPSIAEFSRQTSAVSLVATDFSIKSYQALGPAAPPPAPLLSVSINDLQRVGHKVLCGLPQHQQPSFFCLHVSLHQRQHVPYSLRPP
nr:Aureobasidin resistance protein Aur1 [Polyrhizophydium stewartii]